MRNTKATICKCKMWHYILLIPRLYFMALSLCSYTK